MVVLFMLAGPKVAGDVPLSAAGPPRGSARTERKHRHHTASQADRPHRVLARVQDHEGAGQGEEGDQVCAIVVWRRCRYDASACLAMLSGS